MQNRYKVSRYMTPFPATINADSPLIHGMHVMRDNGFRHLPVLRAKRLVGVISDRDVNFARAFDDLGKLKVEDAMIPDPYVAKPDAYLGDVVREMLARRIGAVIVMDADDEPPIGILTTTDALQALVTFVDLPAMSSPPLHTAAHAFQTARTDC